MFVVVYKTFLSPSKMEFTKPPLQLIGNKSKVRKQGIEILEIYNIRRNGL